MPVKTTNQTASLHRNIQRRSSLFLRFMLEEIARRADPITPKKEGDLRGRKVKQVEGLRARIEWRVPYAAVQERGRRKGTREFRNYTTPGTNKQFAYLAVSRALKDGGLRVMRRAGLVQ